MSVATEIITDASPPQRKGKKPPNNGIDVEERDLVADEAEAADEADVVDSAEATADGSAGYSWARYSWAGYSRTRLLAYVVLPALAFLLAVGAGYLKWVDSTARDAQAAAEQSVQAATEGTIAMLSYRPETVDQDLTAADDRLTGGFRDQYRQLVTDVVAPGSKQQQISAAATVPVAASVSATEDHAVVLVFVNQTTTVGTDAPTQTNSSVRITLDKVGDQWLISQFDPV